MALEIKATLRLFSKTHTLSVLTDLLGEPTIGFSIGDLYSRGKYNRDNTYWGFESSNIKANQNFDEHIIEILSFYDQKNSEFTTLRSEGCIANVFCLFASNNGQGGATLSSVTMKKLHKLKLDLVFDIYAE